MKKLIIVFSMIIILLPAVAFMAQNQLMTNNPVAGNGNQSAEKQLDSDNVQGIQNQQQVQSQNQGEEAQNRQRTEEQLGVQNGQGSQGQYEEKGYGKAERANERAVERRSQIASAVQELLKSAERNKGIGEQVRVLAQNQNQVHQEAEGLLEQVQERSGFWKFIIGPNYKQLHNIENKLQKYDENLAGLEGLKEKLSQLQEQEQIEEQVRIMEQVREQLRQEAVESEQGFSLLGWLIKKFNK